MILLVTPTPPGSEHGNRITAQRWAAIIRDLGHQVDVRQTYERGPYTALIALHARKSADAIRRFAADHPGAPIVVALTGTDLYPDLRAAGVDPEVLALATHLIVLQPLGLEQLDAATAARTTVIIQSVCPIARLPFRRDCFEVAFLAHVRPVKDPLRIAAAARLLPRDSRVRVTHVGAAREATLAEEVAKESADNPRYDWVGPLLREHALSVLARSKLLVLTSWHEGGANVISEALAADVPVIASAIPGSIGLLGPDYPGYFPPGDTTALSAALDAAEHDRDGYYHSLRAHCTSLRHLVEPSREHQAFATLLQGLGVAVP
ncbi:MAG: selenoneine biosynthesis selenosugar synthase SenB [Micromonosporaceae bacterium]